MGSGRLEHSHNKKEEDMKLNIAIVQFDIAQFAPEENLRKAEQFIKQAESQAQLIVFPEDFITGPLSGRSEFADYEKRYLKHFQHLASKYAIDIVPGSIIEADAACLYNTTYYIDSTGEIKGRYRKVNLWHPERSYITAGNESAVFDTKYGRVGLIICWDLMFPEVFRAMLKQDVDMVICPSYWCFEDAGIGIKHDPTAEIKLVNALCVARAFENEVILVYANAAGRVNVEGLEETLIGRSQITVPFKGALKVLDHNKEEMFIEEVDTDILKDAEEAYQIRKDLGK
jgi:predicted amidohydrolase